MAGFDLPEYTWLKVLNFKYCHGLTGTLEPVKNLIELTHLTVWDCYNLTGNLAPLWDLIQLQYLDLKLCPNLTGNLEPLRNLGQCKTLFLTGCVGLEGTLRTLRNLPKLRFLDIGVTRWSDMDPSLSGINDFMMAVPHCHVSCPSGAFR